MGTLSNTHFEFIGIGLDIDQPVAVEHAGSSGRLLSMNAERLSFEADSFDAVLSMSTFEHIADVPAASSEIRRVLRPGGAAMVIFEPVWTCSYGHHLHQFVTVAQCMPDWAHLLWTKPQMLEYLADVWPADSRPTLPEAAIWVYEGPALNRVGIGRMRQHFRESGMAIEWMVSLEDQKRDPDRLAFVSRASQIPPEDLMVKGLSVLMKKPASGSSLQRTPQA